MKKFITAIALGVTTLSYAQFDLNKVIDNATKKAEDKATEILSGKKKLTNDEVINGLKEALSVGTNNSSATASKLDGFNKNPKIKIPFPAEAADMQKKLEKLGLKKQTDKFVETLNRGAEEAAKEAAPIFLNAITSMSIGDGFSILNGSDSAATGYLKDKTTAQLLEAFKPKVKEALKKVDVTKYWTPLASKYNKIPGVKKQNPDLDAYVTQKATEGMFKLIAEEELKIRKDPAARATELLKRVFGEKQ